MRSRILVRQLVLFTLILCATSAVHADEGGDESKSIEKIEVLGGKVTRDESVPGRPVIAVDFFGSNKLNDKYLHLLKEFRQLRSLDLSRTLITDGGLQNLTELKTLTELTLSGCRQVTWTGVAQLRESLPRLRIFDERTAVGMIDRLGGRISQGGNGPDDLVVIIVFDQYERVRRGPPPEGVAEMFTLKRSWTEVIDADLKELRGLRGREGTIELHFDGRTQITDAGIREVAELKNLSALHLFRCTQITGAGLKGLKSHEKLTRLSLLSCPQITDSDLKEVGELKNLRTVLLDDCTHFTDSGLKELSGLKDLSVLHLKACPQITDDGLKAIGQLTSLTELDLERCTQVTDAGLKALSGLKSLTTLRFNGCVRVTDLGLKDLGELSNLKLLDVGSTKTTGVGLNDFKQIVQLSMNNTPITDDALAGLSELKSLRILRLISCPQVTDAGVRRLKLALPRLQIVR